MLEVYIEHADGYYWTTSADDFDVFPGETLGKRFFTNKTNVERALMQNAAATTN